MKNLLFYILAFTLLPFNIQAQENKNEFGVSLFSIGSFEPYGTDYGKVTYISPINSIIYKRAINDNLKLRGILTAETNASKSNNYGFNPYWGGSYSHTARSLGLALGAQTGKTYNKFSPYGYADLFYNYTFETAEYTASGMDIGGYGKYTKHIKSFGARIGLGLEYRFTKTVSLSWEPSVSLAQNIIEGRGHQGGISLDYYNEPATSFRAVNILAVNVKF